MAQANLDSPLTLDPQQVTTLRLRQAVLDFERMVVLITVDMVDSGGRVRDVRVIEADGAQVATYVGNQAGTILTRLLAKLGVTGTIA
jgi:hypothetical protein